ncbi:MAG: hypothetical protein HQM15_08745 [Deltaproteobacteria bacterium]|nr:hypothetical protein [Deltaproteobacteria bacterium]
MQNIAHSKNNIPVRLTDERWAHITEEHSELAGRRYEVLETISNPDKILEGNLGALIAVRRLEVYKKLLLVVYKELGGDGFVITAFLTSRERNLERRKIIWPSH